MAEFWETNFIKKQAMWGFEPTQSAITIKDFFLNEEIKDILIPGIGYGRNAKTFLDAGINVTGIEISQTAIDLAKTTNQLNIPIYHGSVSEMPFDDKLYGGIFCYALIHLLNESERKKFIKDCYNQLESNGYMFFLTISKKNSMYGTGQELSRDWFEMPSGAKLFFYDSDSIQREFGNFGLMEISEIDESTKSKNHPPMKFLIIKCKKG